MKDSLVLVLGTLSALVGCLYQEQKSVIFNEINSTSNKSQITNNQLLENEIQSKKFIVEKKFDGNLFLISHKGEIYFLSENNKMCDRQYFYTQSVDLNKSKNCNPNCKKNYKPLSDIIDLKTITSTHEHGILFNLEDKNYEYVVRVSACDHIVNIIEK